MTTEQPNLPEVAPELMQKLQLLDQVTNVGFVMEQGVFAKVEAAKIHQGLKFLENLRTDILRDAREHPDAFKVPGLDVQAPNPHAEPNEV